MDGTRQGGRLTRQGFRNRVLLIVGLCIAATVGILFLPPIAQDPAYHNFADDRRMLGIPNLLNVISNVPFIVVGGLGMLSLLHRGSGRVCGPFTEPWERWPFVVLFAGVGLTGFGSAYYHLAPSNATLFWDRLPMTLAFMSLFASIVAERISLSAARWLLMPLLAVGTASVMSWPLGELAGASDLRFYGLVQYLPLIAIPLVLLLFPPRYTRTVDLVGAVALYAGAKLFDLLDAQVFAAGRLVSGHTLKHLTAALATYWILRMLKMRQPVESLQPDVVASRG